MHPYIQTFSKKRIMTQYYKEPMQILPESLLFLHPADNTSSFTILLYSSVGLTCLKILKKVESQKAILLPQYHRTQQILSVSIPELIHTHPICLLQSEAARPALYEGAICEH